MTAARVLGIDPGSRVTGFGVVDIERNALIYRSCGVIRTTGESFPDRLRQIFDCVTDVVNEHRPSIVAIENVFVSRNAASALKLGQARSAALCATFAHDVDVFEYSPREIKLAVVGTGAATKEQVQHMIHALLKLDKAPSADAADALAVAVCHAHRRRVEDSVARSAAAAVSS